MSVLALIPRLFEFNHCCCWFVPSGCDRGGHRVRAGCHPFSDGVRHAVTRSDRGGAAALQPGHQAQVSERRVQHI